MYRKAMGAVLVPVVVAVLAGCGGGAAPVGGMSAPPAASAAPSAAHNAADVTFAQGMIPHHQQAVVMAELAGSRAANDGVKQLAARIRQAQAPEIAQMQGFLAAWGVEAGTPTSTSMGGMDHGSMPSMGQSMGQMPGMMTEEQMTAMEKASGPEFDRMFLQMMIDHHEGAVRMAGTEVKDGQSAEAKALAQKITDAQKAEITEMTTMLNSGS